MKNNTLALGWAARANHARWTGVSYVPGCQAATDASGTFDLARQDATNAQSRRQGSNLRRSAYRADAFPIKLRRPVLASYPEACRQSSCR